MALKLTPEILEATYTYLRSLPPFAGWKLPEADAVEFHVTRFGHFADCSIGGGQVPCIRISEKRNGHLITLLMTMAHEMVHRHMFANAEQRGGEHGRRFWSLYASIAKHLGFDPKAL